MGAAEDRLAAPSVLSMAAERTAAQRGLPGDTTRPGFYLHYDLAHMSMIADGKTEIDGAESIKTSFPNFEEELWRLCIV